MPESEYFSEASIKNIINVLKIKYLLGDIKSAIHVGIFRIQSVPHYVQPLGICNLV